MSEKEPNIDELIDDLDDGALPPPASLATMKSKWRGRIRAIDSYIQRLVVEDLRGDLLTPIVDYKSVARKIARLGARGEILLDRSIKSGLHADTILDICDLLNVLGMWSSRIVRIMEKKWGEVPSDWPLYICDVGTTQELVSQSKSLRDLDKMLED